MYWTEWGSKSIKRAGMDGSHPITLLDQVKASGLILDLEMRKLLWTTLDNSAIEMADMDGSGRKVLISENIKMPFSLTLYNDYIYWSDWALGKHKFIN